ncbi:MAG: hypothetical protein ACNA7U_03580 [Candidatus Izemoplasmataceae bacterium]|uniref:hypothetical protein n=1 Tax=Liberiplasma polymorphum TaxID=3374570 RepID=UPI0037752613
MPEISFSGLINFLLGIMSGFVLFAVTYTYFMVRGKNLDMSIIHKPSADVKEEDLKNLIISKQNEFKKLYKKNDGKIGKITFDLSYELIEDISKYYFPKSKYPMLELSVNEILTLNNYITQRVDKILEQPILKNTRNIRITKIVQAYEVKKSMDQKKIIKAAKSKAVKKTMKYTLAAINIVNPAYWFRKLVINTSVDFVTKKICLMIIGVVGEETSKVYSKKLFDKDLDFDLVDKELRALEAGEEADVD